MRLRLAPNQAKGRRVSRGSPGEPAPQRDQMRTHEEAARRRNTSGNRNSSRSPRMWVLAAAAMIAIAAGAAPRAAQLTPFSGTPATIPGQIGAETFDNGGEGLAYHDTTPGNSGGQ